MRGLAVEGVVWDDQTLEWVFSFGNTVSLRVAVPWRIRDGKAILLGNGDHKQLFGLPEPVNGEKEAQSLLASPVINAVVVSPTSDFQIEFGNGHSLEIFNASAGYEGWQLNNGGHSRAHKAAVNSSNGAETPNTALQTNERRASVSVFRNVTLAPLAAERQNRETATPKSCTPL